MSDLDFGADITDEGWQIICLEIDSLSADVALAVGELMEEALER